MTGEQIRYEIKYVTATKSIESVELVGTNILYHLKTGADYLQEFPNTGIIITAVETNMDKHMFVTLSDGVVFDAGKIGVDNRILPAGQDGATYVPHIADGWLSWTNNADMPNPAPIKIVGDDGVSITDVEQITESSEDDGINIVEVTLSNDEKYRFQVRNGSQGKPGVPGVPAGFGNVTASVDGLTGIPTVVVQTSGLDTAKNFHFEFSGVKGEQGQQGIQGIQGVPGEPFQIKKIYTSVAEMEADFNNTDVEQGGFVLINTGNVEDEENAQLYIKSDTGFEFVTDLSGAQGIQGPQGIQGIQGPQGIQGKPGNSILINKISVEYAVSDSGTKIPEKKIDVELIDYLDSPDEIHKKELFINYNMAYFYGINGNNLCYDTGIFVDSDFLPGYLVWCGNTVDYPEYTTGYYRSTKVVPKEDYIIFGNNHIEIFAQEAYANDTLYYFEFLGKSSVGINLPIWQPTIPDVPQGMYLWTRSIVTFSNGKKLTMYSVAYSGKDAGTTEVVHSRLIKDYFGEIQNSTDFEPITNPNSYACAFYALVNDSQTGKYGIDGILTFFWYSRKWTMQLGFLINQNTHLKIRGANGDGVYENWKTVLDSENFSDYTIFQKMGGTGAYINQTGLKPQLIDIQGETVIDGYMNYWTVLNIGVYENTYVSSYRTQLLFPYDSQLNDTEMFIRTATKKSANEPTWRQSRRVLHDNNYSDIIKKINGNLLTKKGTFVDLDQWAGAGQTGYINFARITIKDNYADHTCYFGIQGRGWQFPLFLSVNFANSENNDPMLQSFYYWGNKIDRVVYISKKTTSTWDLWCSKGGGYDVIEILQMNVDYGHFDVTFPNEFSDTRGNGISPTVAGNVAVASRLLDSSGNGGQITATYAKEGMNLNDIVWIACWNGYEIRAIHKNCFTYTKNIDNFFGMCIPYNDGHDLNDELLIRTTKGGIIPYSSSGSIDAGQVGTSYIGTIDWPFNEINTYFLRTKIIRGNTINTYYGDKYSQITMEGNIVNISSSFNDISYGIRFRFGPGEFYLEPSISTVDRGGIFVLGTSDNRWKDIYLVNTPIVSSDRNEKKDISYIGCESEYSNTIMSDEILVKFINELKPCIFLRKNSESGRPHHGFISNDLEEFLKKLGIDHAAFIKTPKKIDVEEEIEILEEKEIADKNGKVKIIKEPKKVTSRTAKIIPGKYNYGLRYEEILPDITRFCQILYTENQNLKTELELLKKEVEEIKSLLDKWK